MRKLLIILFLFIGLSIKAGNFKAFAHPVKIQNYPYCITFFRDAYKVRNLKEGYVAYATFGGEWTFHTNNEPFYSNDLYVGRRVIIVSDNVPFNTVDITPSNMLIMGYYYQYDVNCTKKYLVIYITNHRIDNNGNIID